MTTFSTMCAYLYDPLSADKYVCSSLPLSMQDGWTPLMAASFNGHLDVVQTLTKEAHADIHAEDKVRTCM